MASGYQLNGTDFDDLFEPRQSGDDSISGVGYQVNGSDLVTRYAPESEGSPYGTTGYTTLISGVETDLGQIFAAKGSRPDPVSISAANISGGCTASSGSCQACQFADLTYSGGSGSYEFKYEFVSGDPIDTSLPTGWVTSDSKQFCRTENVGTGTYTCTLKVTVRDANDTSNTASDTFSFQTTHSDFS